jgi:hypothetical protein
VARQRRAGDHHRRPHRPARRFPLPAPSVPVPQPITGLEQPGGGFSSAPPDAQSAAAANYSQITFLRMPTQRS